MFIEANIVSDSEVEEGRGEMIVIHCHVVSGCGGVGRHGGVEGEELCRAQVEDLWLSRELLSRLC
jgi:hypothetical protein